MPVPGNGIIYTSGHHIIDGWTFVFSASNTRGLDDVSKLTIEEAVLLADIAIDNRGRCRKNRRGARGPEPVENPQPVVGKMDPLQANATLLDRLMLQHSSAYRFGGIVDGVGFFVTATTEMGCEGWALIRHYENPYWAAPKEPYLAPCILARLDTTDEQTWLPLSVADLPGFSVVDVEEEQEAIKLALDLTDGRTKPAEFEDREEESDEGTESTMCPKCGPESKLVKQLDGTWRCGAGHIAARI